MKAVKGYSINGRHCSILCENEDLVMLLDEFEPQENYIYVCNKNSLDVIFEINAAADCGQNMPTVSIDAVKRLNR